MVVLPHRRPRRTNLGRRPAHQDPARQPPQVAAGIRRRATTFGFRDTERAGADRCADYLTTKADYLAYDQALAAGWPIATGVIEGACRYIVKDRLDKTGARWGLAGAEAIMRLRALHSNGEFSEYWRYHLRQEHHRNHQTDTSNPAATTRLPRNHPH